MGLASTATVRALLGIPTGVTSCDTALSAVVAAADAMVLDEIDLPDTAVATYNETIDIEWEGSTDLMLRYRPVVSVAALTVSGTVYPLTGFYATESGSLRLTEIGATFPAGRQRAQVCYRAGLASGGKDEAQLSYAANLIAASMFNQSGHAGFSSERTGSYTYSNDGRSIPPLAERILGRYRRVFARGRY